MGFQLVDLFMVSEISAIPKALKAFDRFPTASLQVVVLVNSCDACGVK